MKPVELCSESGALDNETPSQVRDKVRAATLSAMSFEPP